MRKITGVILCILILVLVLNNTYALTQEECKQLCPCEPKEIASADTTQEETQENQLKVLKNTLDLDKIMKEENVSLITIFIDRENNITVVYKAEEFTSNTEEVEKVQKQDIENIQKEKESKIKRAWRTNNQTLAREVFAIEELNRDYIKYKYVESETGPKNVWDRITQVFK